MGRIVITEYMSVDGVVEAPSGTESFERVGWTDAFSRGVEGEKFKLDETMNSEALLLGRVTYEGFAPVWPHYEGEFADKFNTMPKYVVSQTLTNPEWNNTTVLSGDVVDEVRKLKERYNGDIVVHGSPQLVQTLIEYDLVDALHLTRQVPRDLLRSIEAIHSCHPDRTNEQTVRRVRMRFRVRVDQAATNKPVGLSSQAQEATSDDAEGRLR
jgi:dihydrofolate reductase